MIYVIAEAACAHAGSICHAFEMVNVAVKTGCQAVKFQMFQPELIPGLEPELLPFLRRCEWSNGQWGDLKRTCDGRIELIITPFDLPSIARAAELADTLKIPSGRLTDVPFMAAIRKTGKRLIGSTGMMSADEVRQIRRMYPEVTLLHCTSEYPTKDKDVNLNVLKSTMFSGLSDHTRSTIVPALAVAMGAEIIEKHFTLSRLLDGPDQKVSLEPDELQEMVNNIRFAETVMGYKEKRVLDCEQKMIHRKVICGQEDTRSLEQREDNRSQHENDASRTLSA